MDNLKKIALSEVVTILSDRAWHSIYQVHERFRLSPCQIFDAIDLLLELEVIEKVGGCIRMTEGIPDSTLSIINRIKKTNRPSFLEAQK